MPAPVQYEISTTVLFPAEQFEEVAAEQARSAADAADMVLTLGELSMQFSEIERVPRYDSQSRETDVEHSFMLALAAPEIADRYFPQLDKGLVCQFSIVHDLVELVTDDVATFNLDETALAAKEAAEFNALGALAPLLPPHTRELLLRYELQVEPEARFVRLMDKLLPVAVDILGPGKQVMAEDYGITGKTQLDDNESLLSQRLRNKFPDNELEFLHFVRDVLAGQFSAMYDNGV